MLLWLKQPVFIAFGGSGTNAFGMGTSALFQAAVVGKTLWPKVEAIRLQTNLPYYTCKKKKNSVYSDKQGGRLKQNMQHNYARPRPKLHEVGMG